MTLAALLIILFFLPGFVFNLAYYDSESIPLNISLTHKAVASLLITMVLHVMGLFILYCAGQAINFNLFLMLLSGVHSDLFNSITNHTIILAVSYLICLYFLAFFAGAILRWSIKKYRLDRYHFFRIDNSWYYLFKGLYWKEGQHDGVKIAATMEIAGVSYLYVGILDNFFLNKEGSIDRLILASASRRLLKNDKNTVAESERFYPIDGHYFVLKYNEIKNLNVEYFDVIKDQGKITIEYVIPKI
jgi:uncharacterized membrane protein YwzB